MCRIDNIAEIHLSNWDKNNFDNRFNLSSKMCQIFMKNEGAQNINLLVSMKLTVSTVICRWWKSSLLNIVSLQKYEHFYRALVFNTTIKILFVMSDPNKLFRKFVKQDLLLEDICKLSSRNLNRINSKGETIVSLLVANKFHNARLIETAIKKGINIMMPMNKSTDQTLASAICKAGGKWDGIVSTINN